MKRVSLLLLVLAFILASGNAHAAKKKPFRGKVTYQISYDAEGLPDGAIEMMPKTMMVFVGENKTKTVLFTGMGKQIVIFDLQETTKTTFMDIMGRKFGIKSSQEDIQKEFAYQPEASTEILDETMEISGYQCNKIKVTLKDRSSGDTTVTYAWFTKQLEVNPQFYFHDAFFNQIQGILMEYQLDTGQGMMMNFRVTAVEAKKISEKEFIAPEGYEMTTKENLINILGGM